MAWGILYPQATPTDSPGWLVPIVLSLRGLGAVSYSAFSCLLLARVYELADDIHRVLK
jgi:hypothetical protein